MFLKWPISFLINVIHQTLEYNSKALNFIINVGNFLHYLIIYNGICFQWIKEKKKCYFLWLLMTINVSDPCMVVFWLQQHGHNNQYIKESMEPVLTGFAVSHWIRQYFTLHPLTHSCHNFTYVQSFESCCENKTHRHKFSAVIDVTFSKVKIERILCSREKN